MIDDVHGQGPPGFSADFLEKFEILGTLGAGGMGVVYRARQVSLDREVAIKVLQGADAEGLVRFAREARLLASLSHPNILQVFDFGYDGDQPWLMTELVVGEDLRRRMKRDPPGPGETFEIVESLAAALSFAHGHGIVHRDVKPENVFLSGSGGVRLADFGLARPLIGGTLTGAGLVMGTPQYMAPEQVRGEKPTPATDQYALGTLLFELLAGRCPFPGTHALQVAGARLQRPAPPLRRYAPDLPATLEAVVARTLSQEPDRRFSSVEAFAHEFRRVRSELEPAPEDRERPTPGRARGNHLARTRQGRLDDRPRVRRTRPSALLVGPVPDPPAPSSRSSRSWPWATLVAAIVVVIPLAAALHQQPDTGPVRRERTQVGWGGDAPFVTVEGRSLALGIRTDGPDSLLVRLDIGNRSVELAPGPAAGVERRFMIPEHAVGEVAGSVRVGLATRDGPVEPDHLEGPGWLEQLGPILSHEELAQQVVPGSGKQTTQDLLLELARRSGLETGGLSILQQLLSAESGPNVTGRRAALELMNRARRTFAFLLQSSGFLLDHPGLPLEVKRRVYDGLTPLRVLDQLNRTVNPSAEVLVPASSLGTTFGAGPPGRSAGRSPEGSAGRSSPWVRVVESPQADLLLDETSRRLRQRFSDVGGLVDADPIRARFVGFWGSRIDRDRLPGTLLEARLELRVHRGQNRPPRFGDLIWIEIGDWLLLVHPSPELSAPSEVEFRCGIHPGILQAVDSIPVRVWRQVPCRSMADEETLYLARFQLEARGP